MTSGTHLFLGCSRLWRYMKLTRRCLISFDLQKTGQEEIIIVIDEIGMKTIAAPAVWIFNLVVIICAGRRVPNKAVLNRVCTCFYM